MKNHRTFFAAIAVCAIVGWASSAAHAATILKLNLGNVGPDIRAPYSSFAVGSDGNGATDGDQDTDVEFTGFLDGLFPDIITTDASFSCCGVMLANVNATAIVGNILVYGIGSPVGGTLSLFSLYAPDNTLLLSGHVGGGYLTGTMGPPATGAFFTTNLQSETGGTLAPYIAPNSVSLSFNLTNVRHGTVPAPGYVGDPSGEGLALFIPEGTDLLPFTADAFVSISASPIPEPATCGMILLGAMMTAATVRRLHR